MKLFLIIIIVILRISVSLCQTYNGLVKNSNQETIPFASIRIKNTSQGVVCNEKGQFSISTKEKKITFLISCIGYESLEVNNPSYSNNTFYLTPFIKNLDEVKVISISPKLILNKAFEQISNNYPFSKSNLEGYYNEFTMGDDSDVVYRGEAYMVIDMPSYSDIRSGEIRLLKQRCFKKHNADSLIGAKFSSGIFNIYEDDFVRQRKKMIDPNKFTEYEYSFDGIKSLDSMTLYKISFKNKQTEKGKADVSGTIFIDSASYAYVKITVNVDPKGYYKIGNYEKMPETREVTYQKNHDKWVLNHWNTVSNGRNIKSNKKYKVVGNYYTTDFKCLLDKKVIENAIIINKKDVFSDLNYDSSDGFWNGFSIVEDLQVQNSIKKYMKISK